MELAREEWMLELPPDRAGEFGLGPRQFRKTTPQERGDTSVWTDTPSGKTQPRPATAEKVTVNERIQRGCRECLSELIYIEYVISGRNVIFCGLTFR